MKLIPKNNSSATRTANAMDAIAADLTNAAIGFRRAASMYRLGLYEEAADAADGSNNLAQNHALRFYRSMK